MVYVYILQNENDSFYIGTTNDLQKRVKQHNLNQSLYTKNRGPWKLVYVESYPTRSQAMKREYYIKSQKSKGFVQTLIEKNDERI